MSSIHISGDRSTILLIKTGRKWLLGTGVLLIFLGVAAVLFPFTATIATELFIAWLLILGGSLSLLSLMAYQRAWPTSGSLIISLLTIGLGCFLILKPAMGVLLMTVLLAILFVVDGLFSLFIVYKLAPIVSRGWLLLSALVSIVIGLIIGIGLREISQVFLGLLLGVNFILSGLSCVILAQSIKLDES